MKKNLSEKIIFEKKMTMILKKRVSQNEHDAVQQKKFKIEEIYKFYTTMQWANMMVRTRPPTTAFDSTVDLAEADWFAEEARKTPYNVPIVRSKHVVEGLPRLRIFKGDHGDMLDVWWKLDDDYFSHHRNNVVVSQMVAEFSIDGLHTATVSINDYYEPSFSIDATIDMESKLVLQVKGRHVQAIGFHIDKNPHAHVVFDLLGTNMKPKLQGRITANNRLELWDDALEIGAFFVVCDLANFISKN